MKINLASLSKDLQKRIRVEALEQEDPEKYKLAREEIIELLDVLEQRLNRKYPETGPNVARYKNIGELYNIYRGLTRIADESGLSYPKSKDKDKLDFIRETYREEV